ncbi:MAG: hypothetical protein Kow0031_03480 [Anaerolineae bacterium]
MNFLSNFKVGTKIIAGYIIALALMAAIGAVALVRLGNIETTVTNLSDNLAMDQKLADDMVSQILLARFYANKYIRGSSQADLDRYNEEFTNFENLLAEADREITAAERVQMLESIHQGVDTYNTTFEEIVKLMNARQQIVTGVLDVNGPEAERLLQQLRDSAFEADDAVAAHHAGNAQAALLLMRFNAFKYLQAGDTKWIDLFNQRFEQAEEAFVSLDRELQDPARRKLAADADAAVEAYKEGFDSLQADYARQNELVASTLDVIGPEVRTTASNMAASVAADFQAEDAATKALVAQTRWVLIFTMIVAVVVGLGLGFVISRSITRPLKEVTEISQQMAQTDLTTLATEMEALAQGDLTRDLTVTTEPLAIKSKDEIGQMAEAFNAIIIQLQKTGRSFGVMSGNLRDLVSQVAERATDLGAASEQLAASADQAGGAAAQVASTIQQVAEGTTQQTESVTRSVTIVEQVTRAIDGVARGAQEQAIAVAKSSETTNHISQTIDQVAKNAQLGAEEAGKAAAAARNGSHTVNDTIVGMQTIKAKVGLSAQKVQEMGRRSDQIGAIVETIDDIASQTNLLALNAAIEAARAGEHGKGFAVVADEVRKLAEKSATATKEIAGLIKSIQTTVSEAVQAMDEGATEVEQGVQRANQSGEALQEILTAAEGVSNVVESISAAAQQMSAASSELVTAMETVSAVVEENTASTEEMAASSGEVSVAIESIASITEENSAATEEVNAAAEEMNAQVEEVTAAAQTLSNMAVNLQEMVARFKLSRDHAAPSTSTGNGKKPAARVVAAPVKVGSNGHSNGHKVPVADF